MIRWLIRLAVLPAVIVLSVIERGGIYFLHFTGMLCKLIAGTIFLLVIIGFIIGMGIKIQLIKMLAVGFGGFLIPQGGEIIIHSIIIIIMIRIIIRMPGGKLKQLPPGYHFPAFTERLMYDHGHAWE